MSNVSITFLYDKPIKVACAIKKKEEKMAQVETFNKLGT
jgi:hypothetical protein